MTDHHLLLFVGKKRQKGPRRNDKGSWKNGGEDRGDRKKVTNGGCQKKGDTGIFYEVEKKGSRRGAAPKERKTGEKNKGTNRYSTHSICDSERPDQKKKNHEGENGKKG